MSYADVEIRIFKRENGRYPAEITVNSEREFPRGYIDAGKQPATPTSAGYADDKYGEALFRWLFADNPLSQGKLLMCLWCLPAVWPNKEQESPAMKFLWDAAKERLVGGKSQDDHPVALIVR